MTDLELLQKKLDREIAARKQAENILESKALELFNANSELNILNTTLESQIIERTQDFEQAKLLAEKAQKAESNFLASMSHEIRTPLNAIIGMSHLLQDAQLNTEEKEYLNVLSSSANVLQRLITDILDISKIDSGQLEVEYKPFDLVALIKTATRSFVPQTEDKNIQLNTEIDPRIKSLLISDELLINQALINLIGNAVKFTEEGFVSVRVRIAEDLGDKLKIRFEVEDTGIGIHQEDIDKIFEQFKQASAEIRQKYGGTGLGLAIIKKIVETLGGDIKVTSVVGNGSKFTFHIDLEKTDIKLQEIANPKINTQGFEHLTDPILVVEDNKMNQMYISKLLEKWNIQYEIADNGKIASDWVQDKKYALIFMDLQMPVMSGYEATKLIRQNSVINKGIPIIALTASTLLSKKERALDSGMNLFLTKPFRPDELSKAILEYIPIGSTNAQSTSNLLENKSEEYSFNKSFNLKYLEENYSTDLEYYSSMMEVFLTVIPQDVSKLNNAIITKDYASASSIAHKIKPSFLMMGLPDLGDVFNLIEKKAKTEDLEVIEIFNREKINLEKALNTIELENEKLKNHLIQSS